MSNNYDQLQRFLFDHTDVRGEIVQLQQSYQQTLSHHSYPPVVARLLGEFMAAVALMSARLKFTGRLTLQARSEGEIPLIMAEASSEHSLRAIARDADKASSEDFQQLLANGQLAMIIEPDKGQRYQGIVPLDGRNLSACLEHYFNQSEQLSTRIWLSCDGSKAAGILLQELPDTRIADPEQRQHNWQHLTQLTATITADELLQLPFEHILHRLYHQEQVRVFPPASLCFQCSCSRDRTAQALRALGEAELQDILQQENHIAINCEFCHQHYVFTAQDIAELFHPTLH